MLLLAVETSSIAGSLVVAEFQNGFRLLTEETWDKKSSHSEAATLAVDVALKKVNKTLSELSHFAVDVGPGSFTGLRVGINMVRTFAYVINKPIFATSSLQILGFQHLLEGEQGLIALKAVQNFFYFSVLRKQNGRILEVIPPQSALSNQLIAFSKDCTKVLIEGESNCPPLTPRARDLAHMFASLDSNYAFSAWQSVKPLYVRGSEAEEKLKKGFFSESKTTSN